MKKTRIASATPPRHPVRAPEAVLSAAIAELNAARPAAALAQVGSLDPTRLRDARQCSLAGLICLAAADGGQALIWLDRSLGLQPDFHEAMVNRANALEVLGRDAEAASCFEAAFRAGVADPVARYNHAVILRRLGRLNEAIASFDVALQLRPAYPEALRAGGSVLRDLGHHDSALRFFGEALRLRPDYLDALLDRTNLLHGLRRFEDAVADYDEALARWPAHPTLLNNRGSALHELGRLGEAREAFMAALAAAPMVPQAHLNLANLLIRMDRPEAALEPLGTALQLQPDYPEALCSRGVALKNLGRLDEAMADFDTVLARNPSSAYALANRGEVLLIRGELERGWLDYEHRFLTGPQNRPVLKRPVPEWDGSAQAGTRLVVLADQGRGDQIHFARYLPLLVQAGLEVTFLCPVRMQKLLGGVTASVRVVESLDDEHFDAQVALSSLPAKFKTGLTSIPRGDAYLRADPDLVARWAARIGGSGFKVGLCWKGSQSWTADPARSVPLQALAGLADCPGVRLFSLHMPDPEDADEACRSGIVFESLGADLDTGPHGFADTAAVMASLDLVVTCDTSVAHLAGALGRPVWVLLKVVPEWRWLLDRPDSPWYPTMRLFRQRQAGDWQRPIRDLMDALHALAITQVSETENQPRRLVA